MERKLIINESMYKNMKLSELISVLALIFQKADYQSSKGVETYKIIKELKSKGITLEIT